MTEEACTDPVQDQFWQFIHLLSSVKATCLSQLTVLPTISTTQNAITSKSAQWVRLHDVVIWVMSDYC